MSIVWDEVKRLTNLAKHGLDFADRAERSEHDDGEGGEEVLGKAAVDG